MGSLLVWLLYSLGLEGYNTLFETCYYVVLSSAERDESPYHRKQLEDSQILHADCSANFAMCNEHEKSRMKRSNKRIGKSYFLFVSS